MHRSRVRGGRSNAMAPGTRIGRPRGPRQSLWWLGAAEATGTTPIFGEPKRRLRRRVKAAPQTAAMGGTAQRYGVSIAGLNYGGAQRRLKRAQSILPWRSRAARRKYPPS